MDPLSKSSALYWGGRAVKVPGALHMEGCESDVETRDYFFRSQAISRPRPWSESVAATMYTFVAARSALLVVCFYFAGLYE